MVIHIERKKMAELFFKKITCAVENVYGIPVLRNGDKSPECNSRKLRVVSGIVNGLEAEALTAVKGFGHVVFPYARDGHAWDAVFRRFK